MATKKKSTKKTTKKVTKKAPAKKAAPKKAAKKGAKDLTLRGSPEAVAKRRAARALNTILTSGPSSSVKVDRRTERKRQRLLEELRSGLRGRSPLKPMDAVLAAHELLSMGTEYKAVRDAAGKKFRVKPSDRTEEMMNAVAQTEKAYSMGSRPWVATLGFSAVSA